VANTSETSPPNQPSPERRGRKTREAIYGQLAAGVEELNSRLGGLPSPEEAQDIWGDIWFQEAHNSTAIEGNTLVLREVEVLLREGRAVGDKQLAEYLEVQGYADAAQWVYRQGLTPGDWTSGELLSMTELRHIHTLAMSKVWEVAPHPKAGPDERPGSFRRHNIQAFPGGMRPPDWTEVHALTSNWLEQASLLRRPDRPFPEALAALHARFEQIHPFLDGNGRTGRLVMNLLLIRLGYPPAVIRKAERTRYLTALRRADAGDASPLGEFLARSVIDTLMRFVVPAVAGPARLVPLAALASREVSAKSLRAAAERGRLKAHRDERGQWRSTRRWVEEYHASRYRRRR
jgi:fido (protein-threonine AMPylation protein)